MEVTACLGGWGMMSKGRAPSFWGPYLFTCREQVTLICHACCSHEVAAQAYI